MFIDGFALTGMNSGPLAIADNQTATTTKAAAAMKRAVRPREPRIEEAEGRRVRELRRVGKRIAIGVEGEIWLVLHLMIAGRLHWSLLPKRPYGRRTLASFQFDSGSLTLTEAGARKRASLHVVQGEEALAAPRAY